MNQLLLLIFLIPILTNAQAKSIEHSDVVNVSIQNGLEDSNLQTLFDFENINYSEFSFQGESIKGKYFVIRMKEFSNGDLINTTTLFDESGNDYFKIDSTQTSFKFLSKIGREDLKTWIRGNRFGSKKLYFPIDEDNGNYVAKDFFGARKVLEKNINNPFYILAIITPNRNPDGSASYCRVAQSEIDPDNFGKEFNIPHYYLVEIEFTN